MKRKFHNIERCIYCMILKSVYEYFISYEKKPQTMYGIIVNKWKTNYFNVYSQTCIGTKKMWPIKYEIFYERTRKR